VDARLSDKQKGSLSRQILEIQRITGKPSRPYADVRRALQDIIEGRFSKANDCILLKFEVDYNLTFEEMLAAGNYDHVKDEVTAEHFPVNEIGCFEIEVVLVPPELSWVEVQLAISPGTKESTIAELLTLGKAFPDLQRRYPIVACGSRWSYAEDCDFVPCLGATKRERSLIVIPEGLSVMNMRLMYTRRRSPRF
jgi:hypothetical protein